MGQSRDSAIGFIIEVACYVGFWTWRGQTPDKIARGIKIILSDGSFIGPGRSILRYAGYIISSLALMIGYLWIVIDHQKQGIHDKIAHICSQAASSDGNVARDLWLS